MKRLVLFGIVVFLIIIGGFLVVDKVWLHKIFKVVVAKPGSCLILEEKYCKKITIIEKNGQKMAVGNLSNGTILFSPINSESVNELFIHDENDLNKNNWDYGTELVDDSIIFYDFIFSGKNNFKNKNIIKKGDQIGVINNKKLNKFDKYNLVFTIEKGSDNNLQEINEMLLKIFNK